ncbi:MAG: AMP-binding protein [Bacillota bacterium]
MRNKKYPFYQVERVEELKQLVEGCGAKYGEKIAFRYWSRNEEVKKTYTNFCHDVKYLGTAFLNSGLKASNIAVIGENSYEWIVTYFAALTTGNVIVPFDKELGREEIVGLLKESDCRAFVYASGYREAAETAVRVFGSDLILIAIEDIGDRFAASFSGLVNSGKRLIASGNTEFQNVIVKKEQLAAIHYTSGTTGISKGVMLTHGNIVSDAIGALRNVRASGNTVLILPVHHTFGMTAGVISMLHDGICICINSSMKRIAPELKAYKPDFLMLVPLYVEALYNKIWKKAEAAGRAGQLKMLCRLSNILLSVGLDLRKILFKAVLEGFGGALELVVCGGAPMDPKYVKGFRTFGIEILNGYGITECSPIVSVNRNEYHRDGSVGTVLPCCEVMISDPDEHGEGEILVRGDNVMKGYYKNETETAAVFSGAGSKQGISAGWTWTVSSI